LGFKHCVFAPVKNWRPDAIPKPVKLTTSTVARYAFVAALDALGDAGISGEELSSHGTGIIVGSAFGGINQVARGQGSLLTRKSPSRVGATGPVKIMNSTASGNLAAYLGIKGRAYSLSSSFATGTDNIGHAYELIQNGIQDVVICGAAEEACWKQIGSFFDNWQDMPARWNQEPTQTCRPYDQDRAGTVLSEGAGIIILESLDHAEQRGARIYAEIVGYGVANDGDDMFRPNGSGLKRAINQALELAAAQGINELDYINTHGTGTVIGDEIEVRILKEVFGPGCPPISSTKGLTGHGLGAAGAQEAVYTLLMLSEGFIAPTVNLENVAPECSGIPHVQSMLKQDCRAVMSFNVGFGGTNSCLIFKTV
jgi:3-oxoacyl-[acyl-carrier-protein] synthase-1